MSETETKYCCGHRLTMPIDQFSPGQLHRRGALCLECLRKRNHRPKDKWFSVRTFAKYRGIPFSLTLEEFTQVVSAPCVYGSGTNVGIDRIDSSRGYETGNCVPCCYKHNLIKGKWFSFADMMRIVTLFPNAAECGDRPCKF